MKNGGLSAGAALFLSSSRTAWRGGAMSARGPLPAGERCHFCVRTRPGAAGRTSAEKVRFDFLQSTKSY
jgi:hypothetical protein